MTLKKEPTQSSPLIDFDVRKQVQQIKGVSIPVDAFSFYKDIYEFLDQGKDKFIPQTEFHFDINYFNTSSSKALFALLQRIQEQVASGADMKIVWYYSDDDDFMLESGEEFQSLLSAQFDFRKN